MYHPPFPRIIPLGGKRYLRLVWIGKIEPSLYDAMICPWCRSMVRPTSASEPYKRKSGRVSKGFRGHFEHLSLEGEAARCPKNHRSGGELYMAYGMVKNLV